MENMRRDVVITGLGILSSAGANLAEARAKFISGTCCLTPITHPRASRLRAKFAGQIADFKTGDDELAGHDRERPRERAALDVRNRDAIDEHLARARTHEPGDAAQQR